MTKASAQEKSSEWRDLATLKAEGESDPSGLRLREGKNVGGTEVKAWAPAQWGGHPGSGCMMMGSVFRTSGLRNCACVQGWGAGRGAGGGGGAQVPGGVRRSWMCWPRIQPRTWVETTSGVTGTGHHGGGHMAQEHRQQGAPKEKYQRCQTLWDAKQDKNGKNIPWLCDAIRKARSLQTPACDLPCQHGARGGRVTFPPSP